MKVKLFSLILHNLGEKKVIYSLFCFIFMFSQIMIFYLKCGLHTHCCLIGKQIH